MNFNELEEVESAYNPRNFAENRRSLEQFNEELDKHNVDIKYGKKDYYIAYRHTPLIFRELGFIDLPFALEKKKVNKILSTTKKSRGTPHGESMTLWRIEAAVNELSDPIAIFLSKSQPKKEEYWYVALVDIKDRDDFHICVPVHLHQDKEKFEFDFISSVYGRGDWQFENWAVNDKLLIYINTKAIDEVNSRAIRQALNSSMAYNHNVLTRSFIVKKYSLNPANHVCENSFEPKTKKP